MDSLQQLALADLLLRLRPISRALRAAVDRQARLAERLLRPDITPLCVTDDQVGILLDDLEVLLSGARAECTVANWTDKENEERNALRAAASALNARLPFEHLGESLDLSTFEQETVLLCAAVEVDRAYERIFAYILDDLNRRLPCVELLCTLRASSVEERTARRAAIGRYGKLRRCGVLRTHGEEVDSPREELRLASGLFEALTGHGTLPCFRDPDDMVLSDAPEVPPTADRAKFERVALALQQGWVDVAAIWSPREGNRDDVVLSLAARLNRPLRRFQPANCDPATTLQRWRDAVEVASRLHAILWVRLEDSDDPAAERALAAIAESAATTATVPMILSGSCPWRPTSLLSARRYAELELGGIDFATQRAMWSTVAPAAEPDQLSDLAGKYRMSYREMRAAADVGTLSARLAGNGHTDLLRSHLDAACAAVCRKSAPHFATVVTPRRTAAELVLPPSLHDQVLEVADFHRASSRIADAWGLQQGESGERGFRALFTGDSGTGKTLAAEVIAGELHMALLKIDLSRIVSKWVGETEKNLAIAFREAEDSNAVLFFDEADALFGRRGEVRHGVDRYANLEVNYLLQKLDDCAGLVILASNLKDNIDSAFTRRFQSVLHFPRPQMPERLRIWRMAFPKRTPIDPSIDFETLSNLDLTGAGIATAARTAALFAARDGSIEVGKAHVVRAIARQFRREARLLTPADLGPYAALLREPS